MDRMDHFRDAKVMDGSTEILSHVEGYIGQHVKSGGRKQWYGYFELTKDQQLPSGVRLLLVFTDGRVADINADEIRDSNSPGKDVHIAEFYVTGELRNPRRGLKDDARQRTGLG